MTTALKLSDEHLDGSGCTRLPYRSAAHPVATFTGIRPVRVIGAYLAGLGQVLVDHRTSNAKLLSNLSGGARALPNRSWSRRT